MTQRKRKALSDERNEQPEGWTLSGNRKGRNETRRNERNGTERNPERGKPFNEGERVGLPPFLPSLSFIPFGKPFPAPMRTKERFTYLSFFPLRSFRKCKLFFALFRSVKAIFAKLEKNNLFTIIPFPLLCANKTIKQMKKRIVYRSGNVLHIFRFGNTTNEKIASKGERIVQTYHFSKEQFNLANSGEKITMSQFFALDGSVCFDCPFSVSNGAKLSACYTHKLMQYSGFLSSLRSVRMEMQWDEIPELSADIVSEIVSACNGLYIRFGTYGEPSLIPLSLMASIALQAKNWTGYTHQWLKKPEYSAFLMASVHNSAQAEFAAKQGWRSFVAAKQAVSGLVNCPASEEAGFKSTCSKCGLCSGSEGKGNKSVWILEH